MLSAIVPLKTFNWLVGLLLLLLAAGTRVSGVETGALPASDLSMQVWSKAQGLPDNSVTVILQTRDGYLWLGTSAGLARFDGVRFVKFPLTDAPTNPAVHVAALCEDEDGRLWVGTQGNGLMYYTNGAFARFTPATGALGDTINSIAEDGNGNLWLGTPTGLGRLNKAGLTCLTAKDGLPNDFVSNIHIARSGTVWITTRGGMCQFKGGQIIPFPFQTDSPGRSPESLGVYEDRAGKLWAFGDTYLVNLTDGKHLNHFGSGDSGDNLSALRIWSLCEGRNGELWIGTSGKGLYCFADGKFSPVSLRNGGLASDVRALCEDREGNLWLGTYGGGLVRLQSRNVRVLDASAGLPMRSVVSLALTPQGNLWLAFEHGGLFTGNGERFEHAHDKVANELQSLISSLAVTPDASLWVGTPGEGIYGVVNGRVVHYGTMNGLSDNEVTALAADLSGTIWAGTFSGGLNRLRHGAITHWGREAGLPPVPLTAILATTNQTLWLGDAEGRVLHWEHEQFRTIITSPVLGGKPVRALHEDATGRIWIGTAGGRLACIFTGTYLSWDLSLGGTDEPILGILSDADGDLWLSTGKAVYLVSAAELAVALAGHVQIHGQIAYEADASTSAPPARGWPLAAQSPDGKLWFALGNEVAVLDPHRLPAGPAQLPVLVEEIIINGQPLPPATVKFATTGKQTGPLRLPSHLQSLDIQFTKLDLSEPEKIRFRYRLDGYDQNWVENGNVRAVHYGKLNYGSYKFRVQAGTADGWDNGETTFALIVPTPLWRTGWALAIYIVSSLALVAVTVRLVSNRRLRHRLEVLAQQQAMERERMRIAKDMHDEIGSKLTKISYMSERAKGELAGQDSVARKLNSIAGTSRDLLQSLDEIVWAVNPHNDTLEHLAAYLGQYATEYLQNTAVECELHIPKNLPHYPLSAEVRHNLFLAYEEALNNALKHGRATRIAVNMEIRPAQFEIRVTDDGSGFDLAPVTAALERPGTAEKRVGNGLRNLRQRLAEAGGTCHIQSRPGAGTTVTLRLPLGPIKTN